MNKLELIQAVAKKSTKKLDGKDKTYEQQVELCVDIFFNTIKDRLINRDRIKLWGVGSLILKTYAEYIGRNPKTGEQIMVQPKALPCFKPSQLLVKKLNKGIDLSGKPKNKPAKLKKLSAVNSKKKPY